MWSLEQLRQGFNLPGISGSAGFPGLDASLWLAQPFGDSLMNQTSQQMAGTNSFMMQSFNYNLLQTVTKPPAGHNETLDAVCRTSNGSLYIFVDLKYLSWCFIERYLVFLPAVLFGLCALNRLNILRKQSKFRKDDMKWDFYLKHLLTLSQLVVMLVYNHVAKVHGYFDYHQTVSTVNWLALFTIAITQYLETGRTYVPSDSVIWYWFTFLVFSSIKLAHMVYLRYFQNDFLISVLHSLLLANGFLIFLLEWLMPKTRVLPTKGGVEFADAFSKLFILWANPLLRTAQERTIEASDFPELQSDFHADVQATEFEKKWAAIGGKGNGWDLAKILLRINIGRTFTLIIAETLNNISDMTSPMVVGLILRFVRLYSSDTPQPTAFGFYLAILLLLNRWVVTFTMNIVHLNYIGISMSIKGLAYGALFRKSMRFSPKSLEETPTSQFVNILSTDVNFVLNALSQIQSFLTLPVQIILGFYGLKIFLGNAMWYGLLVLVILTPISSLISTFLNNYFREYMLAKDERVKFTSSLLTNAKSLKLYAWEPTFIEKLEALRNDKELVWVQKIVLLIAFFNSIWYVVPYFVCTTGFWAFVKISHIPLTADVLFPSLTLFLLIGVPLAIIPSIMATVIQSKVSFARMSKVLSATEVDHSHYHLKPPATSYDEDTVIVSCPEITWTETEDAAVALKDIDFRVKKGELSSIVGRVGSGKTAFLLSLAGLTHIKPGGSVTIKGSKAYVPQEPWLMNMSVKENILFGYKYDPEFYQRTIEACALLADIENFPDGDETEIGEKGVSLSGGQKARVSLARAVYARADVYLLDDVLSAVDEHVSKQLIDNVLGPEGILKSKTRILATNNIKVLSQSNTIHMVSDKTFVESGTLREVTQRKAAIYKLIQEFGSADQNEPDNLDELVDLDASAKEIHEKIRRNSMDTLRRASITSFNDEVVREEADKIFKKTAKVKEDVATGVVKREVFWKYFRYGGHAMVIISIVAQLMASAVSMSGGIYLKYVASLGLTSDSPHATMIIFGYLLIGILGSMMDVTAGALVSVVTAIRATKAIHRKMMTAVLRSPMTFFEVTPLGRILNRFTGDISELDMEIPSGLRRFVSSVGNITFAMLVVIIATPVVFVFAFPLSFLYFYYQKYYIACTRQLKRISSASRSPLLSHIEESLKGAKVITVFGTAERFTKANDMHADLNLISVFMSNAVDVWLGLRLNSMGDFITFIAASSGIYLTTQNKMNAGLLGLVISNALRVSNYLDTIVRALVDVELKGVTLERLLEYCDLPSEAPAYIEEKKPPATWPSEGRIQFKNYSTRYRENLDLVLKNIDIDIKPREKIGIVGRTGAGKSSLTLALFRIIEAASGHIEIDGVNTSEIGLHDLRSNLSIIPQDSQIFEGSVRDNLDPDAKFDDAELWNVLTICHLKEHVESMGDGLESKLTEGGTNLSRGQAQLISLGRALLHSSNILLLDEATASVDVETDKIIQQTIRTQFKHKTIITIAHRLNTIMDSDRIVVLDFGEVVEFDSPAKLLENPDSFFYALCEKGGFLSKNATPSGSGTQTPANE